MIARFSACSLTTQHTGYNIQGLFLLRLLIVFSDRKDTARSGVACGANRRSPPAMSTKAADREAVLALAIVGNRQGTRLEPVGEIPSWVIRWPRDRLGASEGQISSSIVQEFFPIPDRPPLFPLNPSLHFAP